MLSTKDLVNLSLVIQVPEAAWTAHVVRRCGTSWEKGKNGLKRLMYCVYGHLEACHLNRTMLRSCAWSAYATSKLQAQNKLGLIDVRCLCSIGANHDYNHIAVGHTHGIRIIMGTKCHNIWLNQQITEIAFIEPFCLLYVTAGRCLFLCDLETYDTRPVSLRGHCAFTVSGPVAAVGTGIGVWPFPNPRNVACTSIVQSPTTIAAWHVNGELVTFSPLTKQLLHVIDTGETSYQARALSIIGDVIRVSGRTWCDGRCTGRCAHDMRSASDDGKQLVMLTPYYLFVDGPP